jgi:hypothetical protein
MLAVLTLLASTPAFAYDPGCGTAVWSPEHNHYHCVGAPEAVRYEVAPPVAAPRVYVNLAYGYPGYAYPYYGPRFYAGPTFVFGAPYHRHHRHHHYGRGHW